MPDPRVDFGRRSDLARGQAVGRVGAFALEHLGIETAMQRIADQTVLQPVRCVARGERRAVNHGILARRNEAFRMIERRFRIHQHLHALVHAVVPGRAGEDGVEVGGKALRLLEGHAAAAGAAVEVRELRVFAVKRGKRLLALRGGLVHRAVAEVGQLFRMTEREAGMSAGVSGIGGRGRVAACERRRERAVLDRARPRAIADLLELSVPAGLRQPDLRSNVRVGRRRQRQFDAAERRQIGVRLRRRA